MLFTQGSQSEIELGGVPRQGTPPADQDCNPAAFLAPSTWTHTPQLPSPHSLTPVFMARDSELSGPTPSHSGRHRCCVRALAAFELLTLCQVPSDEGNENKCFFPLGSGYSGSQHTKKRKQRQQKWGVGKARPGSSHPPCKDTPRMRWL